MKKFIQIVTATILTVGFVGNIASAATTAPCEGTVTITNSGDGNKDEVSCVNITHTTITCKNNIAVANINYSDGKTGTAAVTGNESAGYAISGNVINTSNTNTTIDASCATPATPASVVTPSVTPVTPGKGATEAAVVSLPNTASNNTAAIIGISLASAAAVVGLSRAAVAAYRRIGNK